MKLILLITTLILYINIYSQETLDFIPTPINKQKVEAYLKLSEEYTEWQKENYTGDFKKDYKEFLKERSAKLKEIYGTVLVNSEYKNYIEELISYIKSKNNSIQDIEIRPYIVTSEEVNAYNTGEGSIFINLGLFSTLNNEEELVFILGHEISHQVIEHQYNGINNYYSTMYGNEVQEKLKEIKKSKFNKGRQIENVYKETLLNFRHHSREAESEADSFSFELLKNTDYNISTSIKALHQLAVSDSEYFNMVDLLKANFNFTEFPFKDQWLKSVASISDKMLLKLSKELKDSLSTHPNSKLRYEHLLEKSKDLQTNKTTNFTINNELFNKIKSVAKYENINYLIKNKNISKALYLTLIAQNEGDKNQFITKSLLNCLDTIYLTKKDHTISNYVESKSSYLSPEYNKLITFIDNITLIDLKELITQFKAKFKI